MNALAQQGHLQEKYWLDRWRFANDGVFMAHEMIEAKHQFHLSDGSTQVSGKQESLNN
ncbi:MAG: hypothetical protein ACREPG_00250 [Candidatus Binatia bacterium]